MIKWIVSADFRCEDLSEEPRHGMRHYITQEDLQNLQPLQPEETPLTSPDVRHWMLEIVEGVFFPRCLARLGRLWLTFHSPTFPTFPTFSTFSTFNNRDNSTRSYS